VSWAFAPLWLASPPSAALRALAAFTFVRTAGWPAEALKTLLLQKTHGGVHRDFLSRALCDTSPTFRRIAVQEGLPGSYPTAA